VKEPTRSQKKIQKKHQWMSRNGIKEGGAAEEDEDNETPTA
jgi:hypothetical protein